MAKIKYSALVQEMRNKLNGSVLSKNRYGNYVRNKTTPVNPQTVFQQNQRSRLSAVSQAWSSLSEEARRGFARLAENHPYTDIFGDQKKLDGKAMFSKLSLNRLSAGLTILNNPNPLTGVPFLEALSAAFETDTESWTLAQVTVNAATIPTGYTAIIQATEPLPATINFVKNRYRELGTATATAGVINLASLYTARFGVGLFGVGGKRIHVRVFLVDNLTGQTGIASETSAIVEEV